jgi:hypothetical protein
VRQMLQRNGARNGTEGDRYSRGVAQLGESACFGSRRPEVRILSPRPYGLKVLHAGLDPAFFLAKAECHEKGTSS